MLTWWWGEMEDASGRLRRALTHIDLLERELDGQQPTTEEHRELLRLHRLADELDGQLRDSARDDGEGPVPRSVPLPPRPASSPTAEPAAQASRQSTTAQDPPRADDEGDRVPAGTTAPTKDALFARDTVFACLLAGATVLVGGLIAAYQLDDRDLALIGAIAAGTLAPILVGIGTYKGSILRKREASAPEVLHPSERRWSLFGAVAATVVTNIIAMSLAPSWLP